MVVPGEPRATVQFPPVWLTVRVWRAIVAVGLWGVVPVFCGIWIVTCPLPLPLAGATPKPFAVQLQPELDAVIDTCAVPPAAVAFTTAD